MNNKPNVLAAKILFRILAENRANLPKLELFYKVQTLAGFAGGKSLACLAQCISTTKQFISMLDLCLEHADETRGGANVLEKHEFFVEIITPDILSSYQNSKPKRKEIE